MSTVLPTPAPPNKPIFPPLGYGSSRSMTLMPVSRISTAGCCWSKAGAFRWMGQRAASSASGWPPSMTSPNTLNMRPSVTVPTGTCRPWPPASAAIPRARPSLSESIMHRTRSFPMCCATSMTRFSPSTVTDRASLIFGRQPGSNLTSTTEPETWVTIPFVIGRPLLSIAVYTASDPTPRRKSQ